MKKRGVGLGSTLLVTAIVALLGFALAAASVTHISLMTRTGNTSSALDLARSATQLAMGHLFTDKTWKGTVSYTGPDGTSKAYVTFLPSDAASLGLPLSLNNLAGATSTQAADGQLLPQEAAYIVSSARVNGMTRQVRAVVHLPPFPFAAASDGPILSPGNLVVGSLKPGQDPNSPPDKLMPSDLMSNDTTPVALTLGPATTIRGDVRAGGGVSIDPGTIISGKVLTQQSPRTVPAMDPAKYDPAVLNQPYVDLESTYPESTTFTGTLKRAGDVTVNGDLKLDRGLVFITGDMTINGGVSGAGILVVLGDLTVKGQTNVQADSRVAILSKGLVSLEGQGTASSIVKGLIYSEKGVSAKQLKLQGALVARNPAPPAQGPPVTLDKVRLLNDGAMLQPDYGVLANGGEDQNDAGYFDSQSGTLQTGDVSRALAPPSAPTQPADGDTLSYTQYLLTYRPDGLIGVTTISVTFTYSDSSSQLPTQVPGIYLTPTPGPQPVNGKGEWIKDPIQMGAPMTMTQGEFQNLVNQNNVDYPNSSWNPNSPYQAQTNPTGPLPTTFTVKLDPAELLPTQDRARVLLWRES